MHEILWTPSEQRSEHTAMTRFLRSAPGDPRTYEDLWHWSIRDLEGFWEKVWGDCGVIASAPHERVVGERSMPGTEWFTGARLNFAENLLRRRDDAVALFAAGEGRDDRSVTWGELYRLTAQAQDGLRRLGVVEGDRVAGFLPNCLEAVVLMLATASLGAVWSSCSPDFGPMGVVDRFGQIRPKVLAVADGYRYNGSTHRLQGKVDDVLARIDGVEHVVTVDFAGVGLALGERTALTFDSLIDNAAEDVDFAQVPFDHPLYVLYSSGTTGVPKSIVHGVGGTLIQHLKEHQLHSDVRAGDVLFWFTTTGWMMWNWLVSALASQATVVLYDGSPTWPDVGTLWRLAERAGVTHFGTSPKFLAACETAQAVPRDVADLSRLRALLSTGAPLLAEQFDWVYANVKQDLHLASVSGGTDLIGCFACGSPTLPVRRGELQCRALGMAVEAWNEQDEPVVGEKGELVCTQPFPSMPIGFWNDPDGSKYRAAYFEEHPGVWTHGDFIEIRPEGGVVIYGRSDTTLNPGGVRIGTAEIYRAIEPLPEVVDSIVVGRPVEGDVEVVLCVKLAPDASFDEALVQRVRSAIREATTPRHVPAHVFAVNDIPYTISGKKVEKAALLAMLGEPVGNRDALANPQALDEFATLPLHRSPSGGTGRQGSGG